jgi:phthalate 4,5-dioxygenase oxygenase subunit
LKRINKNRGRSVTAGSLINDSACINADNSIRHQVWICGGIAMTIQDDGFNILTRVGPDTPMGNLFRRFWLPALLSSELSEPDGTPVRIRILCEDLLAFRDTEGRVGIVSAYCSHKLAPLFFGRNEQCGIRCVYHGWKFNVEGECVDIPNIVPPDNFSALKDKARIKSYPAREAGGIVWIYMGPVHLKPELPGMEWVSLPDNQVHASRWFHKSNWLQAAEGEIDTSHISFLHSVLNVPDDGPDRHRLGRDGAPHIELRDTDYGFVYGARRRFDDSYYWRVTQWMLPMWSAIASGTDEFVGAGRAWVPIDDNHTTAFAYQYLPQRPFSAAELKDIETGGGFPPRSTRGATKLPHGYIIDTFLPTANQGNDYLIDRAAQRHETFTGIWGVNEQDRALQESMPSLHGGPAGIVDRRGEHLVKSDLPTMFARRKLMKLVKELAEGKEPIAPSQGKQYGVRAIARVSPIADYDEFMKVHGDEGKAAARPGREETAASHATADRAAPQSAGLQ